jgi:hypothetical protein
MPWGAECLIPFQINAMQARGFTVAADSVRYRTTATREVNADAAPRWIPARATSGRSGCVRRSNEIELSAMNIQPIRNEDDHKAALRELSAFFDNEPESGFEA